MLTPINSRLFSYFQGLTEEMQFSSNKNYLFDLSYLGLLDISGTNAKEFLQGQLSCDLNEINTQQMRQGILCNTKGRILALLDVLKLENDSYQLILPLDLLDNTAQTLTKTAILSRVKIQTNNNFDIFGFYLQSKNDKIPYNLELPKPFNVVFNQDLLCYALDEHYFIILTPKTKAEYLIQEFNEQYKGALAWHYLQLQNKRIEIYPESRKLFFPHRLDLHKKNYISFTKGCYKGQEIIARTQYRAKLKHEFKIFEIKNTTKLFSGQKIFNTDNQEIGELVDYCPIDENKYLIAVTLLQNHESEIILEGSVENISLNL